MTDEAYFETVAGRLSQILVTEELRHDENAYPNELEMTLRLAVNAARRAKRQAQAREAMA
jgi:hypothetical protein